MSTHVMVPPDIAILVAAEEDRKASDFKSYPVAGDEEPKLMAHQYPLTREYGSSFELVETFGSIPWGWKCSLCARLANSFVEMCIET